MSTTLDDINEMPNSEVAETEMQSLSISTSVPAQLPSTSTLDTVLSFVPSSSSSSTSSMTESSCQELTPMEGFTGTFIPEELFEHDEALRSLYNNDNFQMPG